MQTFLPFPSFAESARVLDNQRLGKQRVECLQILNTLAKGPTDAIGRATPWYNHPAVRMWRGYEPALVCYLETIVTEWTSRGYKDTVWNTGLFKHRAWFRDRFVAINPPWLGRPDFHASHRSNLLRKLPSHYSTFGWTEPDDLPYIWPV